MPNVPDMTSAGSGASANPDWYNQLMQYLQLGGSAPSVQQNPAQAAGGSWPFISSAAAAEVPVRSSVTNPLDAAAQIPTTGVPPAQQQGAPGYLHSTSAAPPPVMAVMGPPQSPTPWFTGSNTPLPWNGPDAPLPPARPRTAAAPVVASTPAATSTADPIPPRRANSPNLGYYPPNPRFGTMQSQVPGSGGRGPLSNAPIYTTLNLFGGGADKSAAAANPRAVIPPSATAEVPPANAPTNAPWNYGPLQQGSSLWDALKKAPWNYGPLQQNNIWSGSGGPHSGSAA